MPILAVMSLRHGIWVLAGVVVIAGGGVRAGEQLSGSEATKVDKGGKVLAGTGLSQDEETGPKAPSEKKDKKEGGGGCKVQVIDVSAYGTDALWKYPSEGSEDGIVFIPPKRLCHWEKEGQYLGQAVKYSRICSNSLCTGPGMGFDRYPGCLSRTTGAKVKEKFGEDAPVFMVLTLHSGTNMYWHIKDPYARNGNSYPRLEHETMPAGIRCRK